MVEVESQLSKKGPCEKKKKINMKKKKKKKNLKAKETKPEFSEKERERTHLTNWTRRDPRFRTRQRTRVHPGMQNVPEACKRRAYEDAPS